MLVCLIRFVRFVVTDVVGERWEKGRDTREVGGRKGKIRERRERETRYHISMKIRLTSGEY